MKQLFQECFSCSPYIKGYLYLPWIACGVTNDTFLIIKILIYVQALRDTTLLLIIQYLKPRAKYSTITLEKVLNNLPNRKKIVTVMYCGNFFSRQSKSEAYFLGFLCCVVVFSRENK